MTNKNKGSMLSYFIQGDKYKVFLEINKRYLHLNKNPNKRYK